MMKIHRFPYKWVYITEDILLEKLSQVTQVPARVWRGMPNVRFQQARFPQQQQRTNESLQEGGGGGYFLFSLTRFLFSTRNVFRVRLLNVIITR